MGGEFGGELDTWIHMAESLHCSSEIITTLLISYAPVQNKKFKKTWENFFKKESFHKLSLIYSFSTVILCGG